MKQITIALFMVFSVFNGFSQGAVEESVLIESLTHNYKESSYLGIEGEELKGLIKYVEYESYFYFKQKGEEKGVKIKPEQVKSFSYNNGELFFYSLKENFYLKENKEEKIQIFKRFTPKGGLTGVKIEGGKVLGKYSNYVSIENVIALAHMGDLKSFSPFKKKVPALLKACPELAKKVADKEKGYKTGILSPAYVVWLKIAEDYENCAK